MKRTPHKHHCLLPAAALAGVAVLALALARTAMTAGDSAYDATEHGGTDVNADGTTGAVRPAGVPPGYEPIDTADFPAGECIHCHSSHASNTGTTHPTHQFMLFQDPDNALCHVCHDRAETPQWQLPGFLGWAGNDRSARYDESKHGHSTNGAQWLQGSPFQGIANQLNANTSSPGIPGGGTRIYDPGECFNCHNPHGFDPEQPGLMTPAEQSSGVIENMLVRTMGTQTGAAPADLNALCNYCHDNTGVFSNGSTHDLFGGARKYFWYKGSAGGGSNYGGYNATAHKTSQNAYNLWPGNGDYPARTGAGQKGSCLNCHDPHGGASAGTLNGATGGSAASNRALVAPLKTSGGKPTNELCLTCHDELTTSNTNPQKYNGSAAYNASKHFTDPNCWWGTSSDVFNGQTYDPNNQHTYWNERTPNDYGLCVNCHNPHTHITNAVSVNGSTTVPHFLLDTYHNGHSSPSPNQNGQVPKADKNYQLCLDCHEKQRLFAKETSGFKEHKKHLDGEDALCNDCHNPHGADPDAIIGSPPTHRMIAFDATAVGPASRSVTLNGQSTRGPVWFYDVQERRGKAGCVLECHGEEHKPEDYTPRPAPGEVLHQYNYRWYWDNSGTDAALSPGINENTPLAAARPAGNFRLRVQVGEAADRSTGTAYFKLRYSLDGDTFNDLGPAEHFDYADSTHVNDGTTIQTRLLTQVTETSTHANGTYEESKPTGSMTLQDEDREFDFVIKAVSGVAQAGATYVFRVYRTNSSGSTSIPLSSYKNSAELTLAPSPAGYKAGAETVKLFSDAGYSQEIYPQWTVLTAGSTVYVEALATSDGATQKTAQFRDYNRSAVGAAGALTRTGAFPPYTYRGQLTVPASAGQYYVQTDITGSASFSAFGPAVLVTQSDPQFSVRTFADSGYSVLADAFAPGDTVYVEIKGPTDGTPDTGNSTWKLLDFAGNQLNASSTPDSLSRIAAKVYRMQFTMPAGTDGQWYSLDVVVKDGGGATLAQGPLRFVRLSQARETRMRVRPQTAGIERVELSPNEVLSPGDTFTVRASAAPGGELSARIDGLKTEVPLRPGRTPGEYEGRYEIRETDRVTAAKVSVRARWRGGREEISVADATVTFDTEPKVEIVADPEIVLADGRSTARIRVKATWRNGKPAASRILDFRRTSGGGRLLPEFPTTNARGEATARYQSGRTAETAVFEVTDVASKARATGFVRCKIEAAVEIELFETPLSRAPGLQPRARIAVTASPDRLPADGVSTARISATLTDLDGKPIPGRMLTFEVANDRGRLAPLRPATDAQGRAEALYVAGTSAGPAVVKVTDRLSRAEGFVTLELTTHGPAYVELTADPDRLPADGTSTSQILIRVLDLARRPVPNVEVLLEARGSLGVVALPMPRTDPRGEVHGVFRAGRRPGIEGLVASVVSPVPPGVEAPSLAAPTAGRGFRDREFRTRGRR